MSDGELGTLDILVIDDEDFIRKLVVRMLYELGVKNIVEAEDGADALSKIRQFRKGFSVIICDLEMPTMDGFEFVRMLRSDKNISNPGVPVLILTGHAQEENVHETIRLGIHGFLAKPVSKAILEKRILSAISSPPIDPKILEGL